MGSSRLLKSTYLLGVGSSCSLGTACELPGSLEGEFVDTSGLGFVLGSSKWAYLPLKCCRKSINQLLENFSSFALKSWVSLLNYGLDPISA